jgi:hypothetical protein
MGGININLLAKMGSQRLDNESMIDAPVLIPKPPDWTTNRRRFYVKQCESMGHEVLTNHYVELLVRASALLDFMRHNVGEDDEWPLTIVGDSQEAEDCLAELIGRMESAVGCLTEV